MELPSQKFGPEIARIRFTSFQMHQPCLKELLRVGEIVVLIDAFGMQRHAAAHQLHQQILQKGAGIVLVAEAEFTVAALTAVLSFRWPLTADERCLELRDVELLQAGFAIKNQPEKTHPKKTT